MKDSQGNTGQGTAPDSREKILDAALVEFAEFGRAGARVDRIAQRAGLNKAMLYYHFGSKDDLFSALIERRFRSLFPVINRTFDESDSLEAALRVLAEVYARVFGGEDLFVRVLHREMAEPDGLLVTRISEAFESSGVARRVLERMSQQQAQGVLRDMDTRQMLVSFVTMNIGYFILRPILNRILGITDQEAFVAERKRVVVDLFLYGVVNR